MLELNTANIEEDVAEFEYKIAKPYGPDMGEAYIKIWARPANIGNIKFKTAFDQLVISSSAKDLEVEDFKDDKKFEEAAEANFKANQWYQEAVAALWYDHCVTKWESNIQNSGKDIEPTKENFIALWVVEVVSIRKAFNDFQKDNKKLAESRLKALETIEAKEAKN